MAEFTQLNTNLNSSPPLVIVSPVPWVQFPPPAPAAAATTTTVVGTSQTFLFRGFFPSSGQYETWSGPSRNTPPPSGHSLIDITITGII